MSTRHPRRAAAGPGPGRRGSVLIHTVTTRVCACVCVLVGIAEGVLQCQAERQVAVHRGPRQLGDAASSSASES